MRITSSIVALTATSAVALAIVSSPGAASPTRAPTSDDLAPALERRAVSELGSSQLTDVAGTARALGLDPHGGRVRIVAEVDGRRPAVEAIRRAGGVVEASYADLVQALVPPRALAALAGSDAIERVRAPHRPLTQAITGQEVAGSAANVFHGALWTGAGVKVAIIDAGFAGLASRQSQGEIPPGVTTVDFCGGGLGTGTQHGTAVTEIVHEVAPGAQLYLICVNSEVTLGQAKDYVKANGIRIVNTSLAFLDSGRGDGSGGPGTVNGIVADARANGVLWVSAAGNYARRHWSGSFTDADGDDVHDFAPNDGTNTIVVGAGQQACVYLRWDDWPLSDQDFDLLLYRATTGELVASSTSDQKTAAAPPTEPLCYTNALGTTETFAIVIHRFDATETPRFDLISAHHDLERVVGAGSIAEPASSPSVLAVGALCWANASLRPYSSLGPTIDGRTKPDIAGLDGVSNATQGASTGCTGGFTNTSASSALVSGLAALGKEQNPTLTVGQLQTWLQARAQDLGPAGKDNSTGFGRAWVNTFTDTPPSFGLQPEVEKLFRKGTTGGCTPLNLATGARLYCPEQSVSRDQMAAFLVRSLGLSPLTPATPTFADVPASFWAFGVIERLYEQGITGGCASAPLRYCPSDPVRRDQMAAFLVRAKKLTQLTPATPTFADVPASFWAFGYIERLYEQGITGGCASAPPRYCPADPVRRDQMAAFLIRAFGPPTP